MQSHNLHFKGSTTLYTKSHPPTITHVLHLGCRF